jgi:PPOX class probable FMN-dependent enzyme
MPSINALPALRAIYGQPHDLAVKKSLSRLDRYCREFVGLSPFLMISSQGPNGADISPRGDPPGFVLIEDEKTILIPDRPGNNRIDTLENVLHNPTVGLIFLVPGLGEALRINGLAEIIAGPELDALAINGRTPRTALRVRVREVFFHCAKALIRSKLWDPDSHVAKGAFPSLGIVVADQIAGVEAEAMQAALDEDYKSGLY